MQKQNAIYRYISTTKKIQQNVLLKVVSTDRKIFLSTLHKITIMFSRRVLIALLEFVNGHWP